MIGKLWCWITKTHKWGRAYEEVYADCGDIGLIGGAYAKRCKRFHEVRPVNRRKKGN